ncbi:Putative growth response protein [Phaffia rhodozyma]|uniref:Putative growth response protein n=1 Tax=Phaffia rhodozyma TaxID=264483 RepID=A0A0F7SR88_PHARH|nr:Putative growth response protein [Phaffia rhodozyma]
MYPTHQDATVAAIPETQTLSGHPGQITPQFAMNEFGPQAGQLLQAPTLVPPTPTPTVFLSRLPPTCNEVQLSALGAPFGTVRSARFVAKPGEGKSFGFIMFAGIPQAVACIQGLSEKGYKVGYAKETLKEKLERLADPFETNLYVKNLPVNYPQEALERLFVPNIIVSSKMLESGKGGVDGKGVALVRLQTREEAHLMIDKLHGKILSGASAPLVVRFADNSAQKGVREDAAKTKKGSPTQEEAVSSPESWTGPRTPASPPFITPGYGLNPASLQFNPYFQNYAANGAISSQILSMDLARAMYGANAAQMYRPGGQGLAGELNMKAQVGLGFGMGGMQSMYQQQHHHHQQQQLGRKQQGAHAGEHDEWNGNRW